MSEIENNNDALDVPNASQRVEVFPEDLPLCCPMPDKRTWDSHPKIYLPIENSGYEKCPYCGTEYVLVGDVANNH